MANKTITCSKCGTEATYVTTGKKGTIVIDSASLLSECPHTQNLMEDPLCPVLAKDLDLL